MLERVTFQIMKPQLLGTSQIGVKEIKARVSDHGNHDIFPGSITGETSPGKTVMEALSSKAVSQGTIY